MLTIKKAVLISFFITLLIFLSNFLQSSSQITKTKAFVIKVIDGDTLELSNGIKVRLLGINAPEEGEAFFDEARNYLSELVENKEVYLEEDIIKKDIYGRKLAFVFVNGKNVNVEILKKGLAHTFDLNKISKYLDELKDAEKYAIRNEIGIWKKSNVTCISLDSLIFVGEEKVVLKNNCNFSIQLKNWVLEDESHNKFIFPSYIFNPGEKIEIFSTNLSQKFSFKKKYPIWNKEGDSLFLRDSSGSLVLFYRY